LRGYEGVVLLSAEIYADGHVGNLKLKKSCGFAVLDRSALDAVKTWKFEPGRRMGRPISMWVDVPVKFILRDNGPDDVARR
ncbi:MAG: energy transducer TonB, partial [Deltaproteobacteria bacterium]|nr:energy transducer TonB [Deltaproteobacteria bacterium]